MDSQEQTTIEVKKKELTPERLAQLQKARDLALVTRKEKADLKTKEKALAKLELETKKKQVEDRMMALNGVPKEAPAPAPAPPAPKPKKEKKIVYVDPSSSSEEEIEYVKRPKAHKRPVEEQVSRAHLQDQMNRLRREQMMNMMFSSRGY
jgi:hypothetical protein